MGQDVRSRPIAVAGVTIRIQTGCGKMYVTLNNDQKGLCEAFAVLGKAGGCPAAHLEGIARIVSLALKEGVDVQKIIKNLRGIGCPHPARIAQGQIKSCGDALGVALATYVKHRDELVQGESVPLSVSKIDMEMFTKEATKLKSKKQNNFAIEASDTSGHKGLICPECGAQANLGGGCLVCPSCGYSKC